jgi:hypothetical protein
MRHFLWVVPLACAFWACDIEIVAPADYTVVLCVVEGDTLVVGSDERQVLDCADLDDLLSDNDTTGAP